MNTISQFDYIISTRPFDRYKISVILPYPNVLNTGITLSSRNFRGCNINISYALSVVALNIPHARRTCKPYTYFVYDYTITFITLRLLVGKTITKLWYSSFNQTPSVFVKAPDIFF